MPTEPLFERTFAMPAGYVLTARLRAHSIPGTLVRLLPWAVFVMMPAGGKRARTSLRAARRISPLLRVKR